MSAYQFLTIRREGSVEYVTLNRPEVRNAFNAPLIADLAAWAAAAASDPTLRVVGVAGAGPSFCAGADLAWMTTMAGFTREENVRDATVTARMFAAVNSLPVPVVARVHGAALGGGAGLAAVCDVVIADDQAVFGFTEVRLGIIPAVIAPYVLAKIGESHARTLFLTGARLSARRAQEIGLVHTVVPASELDAACDGYVRQFLSAGPEAIAAAKALLQRLGPRGPTGADLISVTAEAIADRRASAEGQEGMRAFFEKRKPRWDMT